MKNWKTTASGIITIVAALVFVAAQVLGVESPEVSTWAGAIAVITAGIGNLTSKDASTKDEE